MKKQDKKKNYEDIINLPHYVSPVHPPMPLSDRAAQFAPFAALTGYGDVIKETARQTDRKPELTEEEKQELDYKLQMAVSLPGEKPAVTITYFVPDKKKAGGYRQRNTCYGEGRTDKSGYGSRYYSECRLDLKDGILSVRPVGYRIDEEMFYRKMTGKD